MKPLPHRYEIALSGGPAGYARLAAAGIPALPTAPPAEYDGPGDAWSPEHLLLAAVETCFLFTLRAVARASKLDFSRLELDAIGSVDRQEGVTRFTDIVLRPRLTVAPGTDHDRALRILEKSERTCLVSRSLSTPIRLEATILYGDGTSASPGE
jgi:peroxiredoxin-like protein